MTCHRYRVGDLAQFQLGAHKVTGTIVEDRGMIGREGRQIVQIAVEMTETPEQRFELPAALLEPIKRTSRARRRA